MAGQMALKDCVLIINKYLYTIYLKELREILKNLIFFQSEYVCGATIKKIYWRFKITNYDFQVLVTSRPATLYESSKEMNLPPFCKYFIDSRFLLFEVGYYSLWSFSINVLYKPKISF